MSEERDIFKDQELRERREQADRKLADRRKNDMRIVMNTKEGRRIMWALLVVAKEGVDCFDDNALRMAAANGARRIGIWIRSRITADEWSRMQKEAESDKLLREVEFNQIEGE